MTGHAPGQWKWIEHMHSDGGESRDEENLAGLVDGAGRPILWFGNSTGYYPTEGMEPDSYTKALIEAAPELLYVAKAALFVLQIVYQREQGSNEGGAIIILEKAIAKAEGRA